MTNRDVRNRDVKSSQSARSAESRRTRLLLIVFAFVGAAFVASLPWQWRQWDKLKEAQAARLQNETRLRDLTERREWAARAEERATMDGGPEALLNASQALIAEGKMTPAALLLEKAEASAPKTPAAYSDPKFWTTLAGQYQQVGWLDRALFCARRAESLAPNDLSVVMQNALIEALLGWQKECQAHTDKARKIAPNAPEPHLALALLHDQAGAYAESEKELLTALTRRPDDWHAYLLLARARMAQRHYAGANEALAKAQSLAPSEPALLAARAQALVEEATGDPKNGKEKARKARELAERYHALAPNAADASYYIGKANLILGDEAAARSEWEKALAQGYNYSGMIVQLGKLQVKLGDREKGAATLARGERERTEGSEYNRLVTLAATAGSNPEPHRILARWCQEKGRLPRAILEWEQVLSRLPNDTEAKTALEKALAQRRQQADMKG